MKKLLILFLFISFFPIKSLIAIEETSTKHSTKTIATNPVAYEEEDLLGDVDMNSEDAELLEEALKDPELGDWFRSRYTFYLAQSYRDGGKQELSLEKYLERAGQGFWQEEVYMSLYSAANLMKNLGHSKEQILQGYMNAYESLPHRAEALHGALMYCRFSGLNHQGYIIGKHAMTILYPEGSLFVEKWIYDYGILDEFSIVAFWSGHYEDSKLACERLLSENKIPDHYVDRVKSNLQYAIDRLSN